MTEAEWSTAADPRPMIRALGGSGSRRKLRLLAVACCQRLERLIRDANVRRSIGLAEAAADDDGLADDLYDAQVELDRVEQECRDRARLSHIEGDGDAGRAFEFESSAAGVVATACVIDLRAERLEEVFLVVARTVAGERSWDEHYYDLSVGDRPAELLGVVRTESGRAFLRAAADELAAQTALVRELFRNPFRPVGFDPKWRSETAVALASGIDADRAFDRLPVLADALEEAGCDHADVLSHCRGPGPHVRGCWVIDLILDRE